jgi:hypothetical protein
MEPHQTCLVPKPGLHQTRRVHMFLASGGLMTSSLPWIPLHLKLETSFGILKLHHPSICVEERGVAYWSDLDLLIQD